MKITSITQQKRNIDNVNIFLDEEFWISLSKNQLIEFGIHKDSLIDETQKLNLEKASEQNKLIEKVNNFLLVRPRSENEVLVYLKYRRQVEDEQALAIITILKKQNLINDDRFAKWFVENRTASGFHGPNKIRSELIQKKISSNIIDQVLKDQKNDPEIQKKELEKIKKYIQKIEPKIKAKNEWEKNQKIKARLVSRGFSISDIDVDEFIDKK